MHYIIMQMKILIASIYFVSDATNHLDDIIITQITAINLPTITQQCMCWARGGGVKVLYIIAVFLVLCRSVLFFSFADTFTTSDRTQKGIGMKLK